MRLYRKMDVKLKKWIKICLEEPKRMIVHTTRLLDTLFYMQSLWWKLWNMEADDIITNDGKVIEWELLYYYK